MDPGHRFARTEAEFRAAWEHTAAGPFGEMSQIWDAYLEGRTNFPKFDEFEVFLRHDSRFVSGIGMPLGGRPDKTAYLEHFQTWRQRVENQFEPEDLAQWPEPVLGSPTIVEDKGYRASVLYIKNFAQAHLFRRIVERHHAHPKGLRLLEIGAGYGGVAEILLRMGIAKSCTVVDLPENLFLAAQFLQLSHPGLSGAVCDRARPETFRGHDLRFVFPNDLPLLDDAFDLIINANSLGEMPAATAKAYVEWISRHISDGGLFISHNAVRVRPDTEIVQRHSDFGYDRFGFVRIYLPTPIAGPLSGHHIVTVLGRLRGAPLPLSFWRKLDYFSALLNFGLTDEMETVFAFLGTSPTPLSDKFMEIVERFYSSESLPEMYELASVRLGHESCDLVLEFLQAATALIGATDAAAAHFFRYLEKARSPMAIAFAAVVLRAAVQTFDPQSAKVFQSALIHVPPYVMRQLAGLRFDSALSRIATSLRAP
jgi:SAM-dependent methyltransferase